MNNIVILGECMVELRDQLDGNLTKRFSGDTYNTAVYLKRCVPDLPVAYLTSLGQDALSDQIAGEMACEALDITYVTRCPFRLPGLYMVHTDATGERSFSYWRQQSAATQYISTMKGDFPKADLVFLSGISLAILDTPQRQRLYEHLQNAKRAGSKIVFDVNYRASLWSNPDTAREWADKLYQITDIALSGTEDHAELFGHTGLEHVADYLAKCDIPEFVVKNGGKNVLVNDGATSHTCPIANVTNIVDTTAAGDAFNAGYLAARYTGLAPKEAVDYGARLATTVIGHYGAIIPRAQFQPPAYPK